MAAFLHRIGIDTVQKKILAATACAVVDYGGYRLVTSRSAKDKEPVPEKAQPTPEPPSQSETALDTEDTALSTF